MQISRTLLFSLIATGIMMVGCNNGNRIEPTPVDGLMNINWGGFWYQTDARFLYASNQLRLLTSDSAEFDLQMYFPAQSWNHPETGTVYNFAEEDDPSDLAIFRQLDGSGSPVQDEVYRIASGTISIDSLDRTNEFIDISFDLNMEKWSDPSKFILIEGEGKRIRFPQ